MTDRSGRKRPALRRTRRRRMSASGQHCPCRNSAMSHTISEVLSGNKETSMSNKPWRGIHVATALPFGDDLSVDYDGFAEHVRWLAENGMDGVAPNGSLGEYHNLT